MKALTILFYLSNIYMDLILFFYCFFIITFFIITFIKHVYIYIYCINKCDANVYNEVRSESLSTSYL